MSTRRLGIGCDDGAEDHGDGELKKVVKVKSRVMCLAKDDAHLILLIQLPLQITKLPLKISYEIV